MYNITNFIFFLIYCELILLLFMLCRIIKADQFVKHLFDIYNEVQKQGNLQVTLIYIMLPYLLVTLLHNVKLS